MVFNARASKLPYFNFPNAGVIASVPSQIKMLAIGILQGDQYSGYRVIIKISGQEYRALWAQDGFEVQPVDHITDLDAVHIKSQAQQIGIDLIKWTTEIEEIETQLSAKEDEWLSLST